MMAMLESGERSDSELIDRARSGDRDAFGELVERHYAFIHRVAYRWCGASGDAEDVAQDVCARLGGAIRGYRGGAAFTTWLYTLTLNAARDWRRKHARETVKTDAYGKHASLQAQGSQTAYPTELLWSQVRNLPDKQRDAVLLVYGEGLSHAAAADAMACAEATVSWHIHAAKKRLRVLMRSGEDE